MTQLVLPLIEMKVAIDRKQWKWYTAPLEKANGRLHIAYMRETLNKTIKEQNNVGQG